MALLGIAATVLAVVPLADRCRAVLADAACISEVDVPALPPLNCSVPPDVDPDAGGFCLFSLPGVPSADLPFAGLMADWTIPEAARPGVSLSKPAVRDAAVRPPKVDVLEPRALTASGSGRFGRTAGRSSRSTTSIVPSRPTTLPPIRARRTTSSARRVRCRRRRSA